MNWYKWEAYVTKYYMYDNHPERKFRGHLRIINIQRATQMQLTSFKRRVSGV